MFCRVAELGLFRYLVLPFSFHNQGVYPYLSFTCFFVGNLNVSTMFQLFKGQVIY